MLADNIWVRKMYDDELKAVIKYRKNKERELITNIKNTKHFVIVLHELLEEGRKYEEIEKVCNIPQKNLMELHDKHQKMIEQYKSYRKQKLGEFLFQYNPYTIVDKFLNKYPEERIRLFHKERAMKDFENMRF